MPFNIEDLAGLSLEDLSAALEEAIARQRELAALSDDDLTDELLGELESVVDYIVAARDENTARETAAQERADRVAAARAAAEEPEPGEDDPTDPAVDPDAEPAEQEPELVTASATPRRVVARAARVAPVVTPDPVEPVAPTFAVMIAAANVPEVSAGHEFADFGEVANAFSARSRNQGGSRAQTKALGKAKGAKVGSMDGEVYQISASANRQGLARIQKPENEFSTGLDMPVSEQMAVILAAATESRLPGGSLVAAGGWCAPSETIYGPFCSLETIDGILSIPEVSVSRGGINFTKGPDYGTLAATWGFLQTEAEAEAGTEKVCYEIACPPFTDVRLDAVGFCITNGVLTNVGYPELTRRVIEIGATAHAHKVNGSVISRISTLIGAAINYTEIGGTVTDLLGGIELSAEVIRYKYSLAIGATVEVVLPAWARLVARQDYANRVGNTDVSPTDAEVTAWFTKRNLAVQWVYDWQPLTTSGGTVGQALPTTVDVMLYPAGAFVKGTSPIIDLDTIYDSVGLSTNTYTAAFFEEGLLVANTCAGGLKVAIALNTRGATGYPAIGAGSGISFAPAA